MKIEKHQESSRTRIDVIDYGTVKGGDFDPESHAFFEEVSSRIIRDLKIENIHKHDGPDSSRWTGELRAVQISFEFDDMLGTTIYIHSGSEHEYTVADEIHSYIVRI